MNAFEDTRLTSSAHRLLRQPGVNETSAGPRKIGRFQRGRGTLVLGAGVLAVVVVLAVGTLRGVKIFDFTPASSQRTAAPPSAGSNVAGSDARFQFLAAQTSNSCGLQANTVLGYADSQRIQGACCNPMDIASYQAQVRGLAQFASTAAIPKDPYDIPAALAKQLLGYDSSIKLSSIEQAVFDQAMSLTPDKAPCCCKCWRWYASSGLAKHLIHDLRWDAPTVGKVVTLVNGCGGKREVAIRGSPRTG